MPLNDGPPERRAPIPELLETYKAQRVRLVAQTRELERLRDEVRGSAEREAAAIVTAARRNVRQVLLDARRELLVLAAQVQAVGCDTPASDKNVVQGEATSVAVVRPGEAAPPAGEALTNTRELVTDARRDVREVLVEAQSELMALSEEAKALRARLAGRQEPEPEPAPAVVPAPLSEPDIFPAEIPEAAPPVYSSLPSGYSSLTSGIPSGARVWISVAAAVAFAAVGAAVFLLPRASAPASPAPSASRVADAAATAGRAARDASPAPASAAASPASAPADPSKVSLAIEVRRPAWIRTTVDGRPDAGRVYAAGETKTIASAREVVMRVGDAGAVFVSLNGAEARPLGANGLVITRRFAGRQPAVQTAAADRPAPAEDEDEPETLARTVATDTAQRNAATQPPVPPLPASPTARTDVGTTGAIDPAAAAGTAAARLTPDSASAPPAEREILRATQRWFEAFFGGDRAGMAEVATEDFALTDERTRPVGGAADVDRSMQQVRIEVAGDGAVLSARLMERVTIDGNVREYVSLVSGVWIRRDGRWRLMAVRFVDPGTVGLQH